MDAGVTEMWLAYRARVDDIYLGDGGESRVRENLDPGLIEEAAGRCEELTQALVERISESVNDWVELETAAVAMAVVDVAVAVDVLVAVRSEGGLETEGFAEGFDEPAVSAEELEPIGLLIAWADEAFGVGEEVIGGGAPGADWPVVRTRQAVDDLVHSASPLAAKLGLGIVGSGISLVAMRTGGLDPLERVLAAVAGAAVGALRIFVKGLEKLSALTGWDASRLAGFVSTQLLGPLERRLDSIGEAAIRCIVSAARPPWKVEKMLLEGRQVTDPRQLDSDLSILCGDFAKTTRQVEVIRKRFGFCAPVIGLITPPFGKGAVIVAYTTALGFVVVALADRLDTMPLDRVAGVPTIVERHMA